MGESILVVVLVCVAMAIGVFLGFINGRMK